MISLLAAIQFLLLSPAFVRRAFTARELGAATAFYPLVGLLLGALLVAADFLLGYLFPLQVRSALVLALWVVLTGGLHLDGFLDTCDGLLGGSTPERRLDIMRDERVGAYALAGGVILLLTLFSSLGAITTSRWVVLLLAPILGRWGIALAVVSFPYARRTGLGRDIKDHAGIPQLAFATFTTLVIAGMLALLLRTYSPLIALAVAALICWLGARFIMKRIPGMTGDTYGALNMLIEAGVLLTFVAIK
jgi:adenosylcobinamide-GDP ribazoletransferase